MKKHYIYELDSEKQGMYYSYKFQFGKEKAKDYLKSCFIIVDLVPAILSIVIAQEMNRIFLDTIKESELLKKSRH